MSAIDLSSVVGLVAVGLLTANILLGLLISSGYNPTRRWPRRRVKLFPFHKWTGYSALAVAFVHPVILLFSSTAGFRPLDAYHFDLCFLLHDAARSLKVEDLPPIQQAAAGFAWALLDDERLCWHDRISRSYLAGR